VALAAFLPIRLASAMGVFLAGVYLSMTGVSSGRSGMSRSSRLGMMFLALSGTLLWGKMLIRLVPMTILRIDAKLAGTIAGVAVNGNLMSNHGAAGGVVIYPGCSSVHNMSLAVILWAALLCNFAIRPNRKLVAFGALAVFSMGLINVIRLSSLVYFPGYFDFLHEGFGGFLFGLASLIVSGTIISYGIIHSARIPA